MSESAEVPPDSQMPRAPFLQRIAFVSPALLVAAIALTAVVWQWIDSRTELSVLRQEMARRLSEAEAFNRESRTISNQSRDGQRDTEVRLGMLEARVLEAQNQRMALEALYQELQKNRDERVLAEIEQLLLIAGQQLQLAGNIKAALIALETADSRLSRADRPQLIQLRKVINNDMERLRKAPFVDVVGNGLKLDQLASAVDSFPLALEEKLAQNSDEARDRGNDKRYLAILSEYWNDLKSSLRIRYVADQAPPLVAPEQAYFLRENLKLRLLGARLALLAHDDASFKVDIKAANGWMRQYFDPRHKNVAAALATLQQLAATEISVELPDISASLDAVRNYKLVRLR